MITYKLFKTKNDKLYPLYVNTKDAIPIGEWVKSKPGELVDETHVKASGCGGKLALRSGHHSTKIPFTDWIGKRQEDGTLAQRQNYVWCKCEVRGSEIESRTRNGYRIVPEESWYYFKTNTRQKEPWIISDWIRIIKVLSYKEVADICHSKGIEPQAIAS